MASPLSYRQTLEAYDRARAFGETRPLQEWASGVDAALGEDRYAEAGRDGWWTKVSTRLDQALEDSPLGVLGGAVVGGTGVALKALSLGRSGADFSQGYELGTHLPRMFANTLPLAIPGVAPVVGAGLTGLAFGAHTYADTGSGPAAVVSGITGAALPTIGKFAGNLGARVAGGEAIASELSPYLPEMAGVPLARTAEEAGSVATGRLIGSQVGQLGTLEASNYATAKVTGSEYDPLSGDMLLTQVPFTVFDIIGHRRGPRTTKGQVEAIAKARQAEEQAANMPKVVPQKITTPEEEATTRAATQQLATKLTEANGDPKLVGEALENLVLSVQSPEKMAAVKATIVPSEPADVTIRSKTVSKVNAATNSYRVLQDDGNTVFVNNATPSVEADGTHTFTVKPEQVKPADYSLVPEAPVVDPNQPELPTRVAGQEATSPGEYVVVNETGQEVSGPLSAEQAELQRQALGDEDPFVTFTVKQKEKSLLGTPEYPSEVPPLPSKLDSADIQGLQEMGVAPESMTLVEPGPVKESVAAFEQAKQAEREAQAKTTVNPQTAAEWYSFVSEGQNDNIRKNVESGATVEQAVEAARLVTLGDVIDNSRTEQNIQKAAIPKIVRDPKERAQIALRGQAILDSIVGLAAADPNVARILNAFNKVYGDRVNVTEDALVNLARQYEKGANIDRIIASFSKVTQNANRPGSKTSLKYPGSPVFKTEAEANQYLADHPEIDTKEYAVQPRTNKRTAENGGDYTTYNIKKRVFGPEKGMSLDAEVGEGNATLHSVVELGTVPEPEPLKQSALSAEKRSALAKQVVKTPEDFATQALDREVSESDVQDVQMQLHQYVAAMDAKEKIAGGGKVLEETNKLLRARGQDELHDVEQLSELVLGVQRWIDQYRPKVKAFYLSEDPTFTPEDKALHAAVGAGSENILSSLDYIAKANIPFFSQVAQAYQAFSTELSRVRAVWPGAADHLPPEGWYYNNNALTPAIQVSRLPNVANLEAWAGNFLHEVTHSLSQDLLSKTNDLRTLTFRMALDQARKVAIENLPPKVRALVEKAIKEDHLGQYRLGKLSPEELQTKWNSALGDKLHAEYEPIIYGLLSNEELLAQAFGSKQMVALLSSISMPKQKNTILRFLSGIWNGLFGGKPEGETAFERIVLSFDKFLTSGVAKRTYNGVDFIRDSLMKTGVRPEALASRVQTIDRMFLHGTLGASLTGYNREGQAGVLPVTNSPWADVIPDPAVLYDVTATKAHVVGALAKDVPALQDLWNQMRQNLDVTEGLVKEIKAGRLPGELSPNVEANLKKSRQVHNAFKDSLRKQERALRTLNDIQSLTSDGFTELQARQLSGRELPATDELPLAPLVHGLLGLSNEVELPSKALPESEVSRVRRETAEKTLAGKNPLDFITKNLMLTSSVKRLVPQLKAGFDAIAAHIGAAVERITGLNALFIGNDAKIAKDHQYVVNTPRLNKATSDILRYRNEQSKAGRQWTWADKYVKETLRDAKMNAEDIAKVQQLVKYFTVRHEGWLKQLEDSLYMHNAKSTARVIMAGTPDMVTDTARSQAMRVHELVQLAQDPQQALAVQQGVQALSTEMAPEVLQAALKHASSENAFVAEKMDVLRKQPDYAPEQRYDKFQLVMRTDQDKPYNAPFETREAALAEQQKLEKRGYKLLDFVEKGDLNTPRSVNQETFKLLQELDQRALQYVEAGLPANTDPVVRQKIIDANDRAKQYATTASAFPPLPGSARKLVEGRENIDMLKNAHEFYGRAVNWIRNRDIRLDAALEAMHPEIAGSRPLIDFMQQHVENVLTPDNEVARKINQGAYYWKLAGNLGQTLLESMQTLTTGMQSLIQETGSVKDALRLTIAANKELYHHKTTGKWSDPLTEEFAERATREGQFGRILWDDVVNPDTDKVQHMFSQSPNLGVRAATALGSALRKPTAFFQTYNDRVGGIAAYKLAREQGKTGEDAYRFAISLKGRGLFTEGKNQRPVGLFGIKTRAVPQLISTLQTYTLGWFSNMLSDFKIGFRDAPKGTTALQKQGARKAFIYGLAAQALVAGALGMPGMGQAVSLIQQSTGEDVKGWLRTNLAGLFGEDQQAGGMFTNLALRGATAGFTGIDLSNRAAMGVPFIGVDPYKGFQLQGLLGAAGSTVGDVVNMVQAAMQGDQQGFAAKAPAALRGPLSLLQGGGDIRDKRGALIYKLSTAEQFAQAIGITPSGLSQQRDVSEAVGKMNDAAIRQRQELLDQVAQLARTGQKEQAVQVLLAAKAKDPEMDLTETVRGVAGRAEKQNFAYDWRRDLDPSVQLEGLGSRTPANNAERLSYRNRISQLLGVMPNTSPNTILQAGMTDELMNSNPFVSQSQASRRVQGSLRGASRSALLLPQELQ